MWALCYGDNQMDSPHLGLIGTPGSRQSHTPGALTILALYWYFAIARSFVLHAWLSRVCFLDSFLICLNSTCSICLWTTIVYAASLLAPLHPRYATGRTLTVWILPLHGSLFWFTRTVNPCFSLALITAVWWRSCSASELSLWIMRSENHPKFTGIHGTGSL